MSKQLKAKSTLSEIERSIKRVFSSPEGKLVLDHLKKTLHYGETVYKSHKDDLHFELGRQSVINDIQFVLDKKDN